MSDILKVSILFETQQAVQNIKKFGGVLESTMARTTKNVQTFSKATGQANTALVNFGRVVQDAPFGLIGIANNIDPLVTSFQNLGVAARQNGTSALKELGKALTGPAGIAIGVSAVTSLLIAFGDDIAAAITKVTAFDKAQREAGTEGAKAFAQAQSEFRNYIDLIDNASNSAAKNEDILKKVNAQLNDYGLKIKSVSDLQRVGAQVGALFAEIKREEAKAQVLAAAAAQEYAKQVALGIKAQQGDVAGIFSDISFGDKLSTLFGGLFAGVNLTEGFANAVNKSADAQKQFDAAADSSRAQIEVLVNALKQIPGVYEDFSKGTKGASNSVKESNKLSFEQFGLTKLVTRELSAQEQALKKLTEAQQKENDAKRARTLFDTANGNQTVPEGLNFGIPKAVLEQAKQNADIVAANLTKIQTATENTNAAFSLLGGAIDQAFNALANGQNPIDAVKQAIKQLIVQLAKAVVQAVVLSAVLNAIAPGSSAALGGVGGILKNLLGFRANGGPVGAGNAFLVGERGPELFVPNQSGRIMNNSAMIGAGGMQIIPTLEFSYDNLRIAFNRANASAGRRL
jgi:hypothetical protein